MFRRLMTDTVKSSITSSPIPLNPARGAASWPDSQKREVMTSILPFILSLTNRQTCYDDQNEITTPELPGNQVRNTTEVGDIVNPRIIEDYGAADASEVISNSNQAGGACVSGEITIPASIESESDQKSDDAECCKSTVADGQCQTEQSLVSLPWVSYRVTYGSIYIMCAILVVIILSSLCTAPVQDVLFEPTLITEDINPGVPIQTRASIEPTAPVEPCLTVPSESLNDDRNLNDDSFAGADKISTRESLKMRYSQLDSIFYRSLARALDSFDKIK